MAIVVTIDNGHASGEELVEAVAGEVGGAAKDVDVQGDGSIEALHSAVLFPGGDVAGPEGPLGEVELTSGQWLVDSSRCGYIFYTK